MAISEKNILLQGLHGRVGQLIFRSWGDVCVVSAAPGKRKHWSKAQQENRQRFREAMAWARVAMENPGKRQHFRRRARRMQTAWNVAVADYMLKPVPGAVDLTCYHGNKGEPVEIKMRSLYCITNVLVTILTAQGVVAEQGKALQQPGSGSWIYVTQSHNQEFKGCRVVIEATDSSGGVSRSYYDVKRE